MLLRPPSIPAQAARTDPAKPAEPHRGHVRLAGLPRLVGPEKCPPVRLALDDLRADFARVLGTTSACDATITVQLDDTLPAEQFRIETTADHTRIHAGDPLGAVFGIYEFSRRFLGVDPLWFWKSVEPARRAVVSVPIGSICSTQPRFRYRGWFINDEDLLTEFMPPSGSRSIDYPFYAGVANLALLDRVFEALLRSGGNMVIPASFIDVMNEPEAAIIRLAVARGLFVSQHHVEPLGVSHFAFENYWKSRGEHRDYLYSRDPECVRLTWQAYAQKWTQVAGDRVVWQLGLRGRGDAPVWTADDGITRATGARFISRAVAEQVQIIRAIDPRPSPPMTLTLFLEGAELMADGRLELPEGITIVFSDDGPTQQLQRDFHVCPRLSSHTYGVYYHVAFWRMGPHLIQGCDPNRLHGVIAQLESRGDVHYAIANVSNLREHTLGAQAFLAMTYAGAAAGLKETTASYAPPPLMRLIERFIQSLATKADGSLIQDGDCNEAVCHYVEPPGWMKGRRALPEWIDAASLEGHADRLLEVANEAESASQELDPRWRDFASWNIAAQSRALAHQYRALARILSDDFAAAAEQIERSLRTLECASAGRWADWYRGERKCHWRTMAALLRRAE